MTVTAEPTNAAGDKFQTWTVEAGEMNTKSVDMTEPSMTFSMPKNDLTLKANYISERFELTVNGGSGSGSYAPGETIVLTPDQAQAGMQFSYWMVQADAAPVFETSEELSYVMPECDVIITAVFETKW